MTTFTKKDMKLIELRKRYILAKKGKESLAKILLETEVPEHVYDSNAIENSTLTLEETEKLLLQIDLDRYVSEREIHEAKNLARVMEYADNNAQDKKLGFEMILFLHKLLLGNIRGDIAGRFRQEGEFVRVGSYIAVAPSEIEGMLQAALDEFDAHADEPITRRIARLHLAFECIHPFIDGNGRIGRVINNYLLLREQYVPINIQFVEREKYYKAFKEYESKQETGTMEEIVLRALTNSFYRRLAYLEEKRIVTLNQYAKETKQSHSNLINKAKRQTIEAFLEKGVWKIGI